MNCGIIGTGRVGTNLGLYLQQHNVILRGFYDINNESLSETCQITNTQVYTSVKELILNNDLIFITTNDDAIKDVVNEIKSINISNKTIGITSGANSINTLSSLKGHNLFVLHPILSFNDKVNSVSSMNSCAYTLEYSGEKNLKEFINTIFTNIIEFDGNKSVYHAAACMTSNYLITLLNSAFDVFEQSGVHKNQIKEIMKPLVVESVNNFFSNDKTSSLTGPISRGDVKSIKKHLNSEFKHKELYKLLGIETTIQSSENDYISNEKKQELLEVLYENNN